MKWMNTKIRRAALDYAEAILEACTMCKVADPLRAVTDTDAYPRLQKVPCVEFAIGWLHGCADMMGVKIEVLWAQIEAERAPRRKAA